DRYHMEKLQMQASAMINWFNFGYHNENGVFYFNSGAPQVRGAAWAVRTVVNAAYITPDTDALKEYFNRVVDNEARLTIQKWVRGDGPLQGELRGHIWGYNFGSSNDMSPWQDDFFTIVY